MKKTILLCFVLYITVLCALPCHAANNQNSHGVYAQYNDSNSDNIYISEVSNGICSISTKEEIVVNIESNESKEELKFVLHVITPEDEEPYEWFQECLKDIGSDIVPLDIFFMDEENNHYDIENDIEISVDLPEGITDPTVCYVATDGTVTVLDSYTKDGKLYFSTNHNSYYVIAQKNTAPVASRTTMSNTPQLKKASINTIKAVTISILVFASVSVFVFIRIKKITKNTPKNDEDKDE